MKLLFLQYENRTQGISFYINSPGGSVSATLALYDTMQFIDCPVNTYCIGMAASGAAVLLAGGQKGRRYSLPHSKVMIHQPYGQVGGQVSDIEIQAEEIVKITRRHQRDPRQAHRPAHRADRQGHRARPLPDRHRGQGIRPRRRGRRPHPGHRIQEGRADAVRSSIPVTGQSPDDGARDRPRLVASDDASPHPHPTHDEGPMTKDH